MVRMNVPTSVVTAVRRSARHTEKHKTRIVNLEKRCVYSLIQVSVCSQSSLQGSKIRSTYIVFAQKEKKRLEALVQASTQEVAEREKEVARLKGIVIYEHSHMILTQQVQDVTERAESLSAAALEHKQESRKSTSSYVSDKITTVSPKLFTSH